MGFDEHARKLQKKPTTESSLMPNRGFGFRKDTILTDENGTVFGEGLR
jgi:hypothetical protein